MLPPKLILAPIDFSDSSRAALDVAADFATRFGAELLLVHVQPAIEDLPKSVSRRWKGQQRHPTKPIFRHITLLLLLG